MLPLFLLADSRLPSGGHGHSGGVEALVDRGLVRTAEELALFLEGRVRTGGRVVAAAAAAACAVADGTPAEPDRVSGDRVLEGAALLRTVSLAFPTPAVAAFRALPRVHHPLVLGAAAAAAGADPAQAAALALHHLVGGAATAAVRLLGLDPLRVAAVSAAVARAAEPVAAEAATRARAAVAAADPGLLPAEGSPLTDVLAELHRA